MPTNHKTIAELMKGLNAEVRRIKEKYHFLRPGDPFVLWFAEAQIVGDREKAKEGVIGEPCDTGVDAVYVDEGLRIVHLVQGKYHYPNWRANDKADLLKFAEIAGEIWDRKYEEMLNEKNVAPLSKKRLLQAHARLRAKVSPSFTLKMHFATTGRITSAAEAEARRIATATDDTQFEVVAAHHIPSLFSAWLDAAAPPLPEMAIKIEGSDTLTYEAGSLHGWVFTSTAREVCRLYAEAGDRIFARNIRGYQGDDTRVNKLIIKSAEENAPRFWFLNNGVTIIADSIEKVQSGHEVRMRMSNPQVVNGQQTVRSLTAARNGQSRVLVRAIDLAQQHAADSFGGLVGDIVQATNRQNAIDSADLMANDAEQVRIERGLKDLYYAYARKKQAVAAFAVQAGMFSRVRRQDLANALASTVLGSHTVRRQDLWEKTRYPQLFAPKRAITDYLVRWLAAREVKAASTELIEARWVVLACLWHWTGAPLGDILAGEWRRRAFIEACQKKANGGPIRDLRAAAKRLFVCAKPVYVRARKLHKEQTQQKGKPFRVLTPDAYFRREEAYDAVMKAALKDTGRKRKITSALDTLRAGLLASN